MHYELVKELKDAGFPFDWDFVLEDVKNWKLPDVAPTLSELIEACGNKFDCLKVQRGLITNWSATGNVMPGFVGYGPTMEVAVANLWLAINNKL